jgi:hypothetical protein
MEGVVLASMAVQRNTAKRDRLQTLRALIMRPLSLLPGSLASVDTLAWAQVRADARAQIQAAQEKGASLGSDTTFIWPILLRGSGWVMAELSLSTSAIVVYSPMKSLGDPIEALEPYFRLMFNEASAAMRTSRVSGHGAFRAVVPEQCTRSENNAVSGHLVALMVWGRSVAGIAGHCITNDRRYIASQCQELCDAVERLWCDTSRILPCEVQRVRLMVAEEDAI